MISNNYISTTEYDELIEQAVEIALQYDRVSASLLQRRLSIGYARAARLIDQLEALKIVSVSEESSKAREVLIHSFDEYKEMKVKGATVREEPQLSTQNNYKPKKAFFLSKDLLNLKNPKEIVLGYNEKGVAIKADFNKIGNLIVIGNPISKKMEFIDSYLISLLANFKTTEVNTIIYDSSTYLFKYNKIPHNLCPVIGDYDKAVSALRWLIFETDRRFKKLTEDESLIFPEIYFVYNYDFYNIETIDLLKRITSIANRAGVHIILLTDQLSDIPKTIRDNIPARLNFDKYGEYESVFEFKDSLKLESLKIDSLSIRKYLEDF